LDVGFFYDLEIGCLLKDRSLRQLSHNPQAAAGCDL
jgi:hypothetical protein